MRLEGVDAESFTDPKSHHASASNSKTFTVQYILSGAFEKF
jgi:hypothetical protein